LHPPKAETQLTLSAISKQKRAEPWGRAIPYNGDVEEAQGSQCIVALVALPLGMTWTVAAYTATF